MNTSKVHDAIFSGMKLMDATLPWFGESAKSEAKAEEAQVQTELVQPTVLCCFCGCNGSGASTGFSGRSDCKLQSKAQGVCLCVLLDAPCI